MTGSVKPFSAYKENKIMNEQENLTNVSQQETVNDSNDYIEAIREMKQNSVSKEAYEKLKAENKQLLDSIINGTELPQDSKPEPVDINKLRKELFTTENDMSNLEFVSTALKLRDEILSRGEKDPFLPAGEKIIPTEEDINTANRVASILKDCVDYADGDSALFTSELQRVTIDSSPMRRR